MKTYLSGLILVLLALGSIGYVSNASNAPRTNVSSTVSTILSTELITPMTTQPIADSLEMLPLAPDGFGALKPSMNWWKASIMLSQDIQVGMWTTPPIKK